MQISRYARHARSTAIYPVEFKVVYPMFGLVGEVGEFCNKYKKIWRDNREFSKEDQKSELGDILWYWNSLCLDLDLFPTEVAIYNLDKLRKRMDNDKLHGDGDSR